MTSGDDATNLLEPAGFVRPGVSTNGFLHLRLHPPAILDTAAVLRLSDIGLAVRDRDLRPS